MPGIATRSPYASTSHRPSDGPSPCPIFPNDEDIIPRPSTPAPPPGLTTRPFPRIPDPPSYVPPVPPRSPLRRTVSLPLLEEFPMPPPSVSPVANAASQRFAVASLPFTSTVQTTSPIEVASDEPAPPIIGQASDIGVLPALPPALRPRKQRGFRPFLTARRGRSAPKSPQSSPLRQAWSSNDLANDIPPPNLKSRRLFSISPGLFASMDEGDVSVIFTLEDSDSEEDGDDGGYSDDDEDVDPFIFDTILLPRRPQPQLSHGHDLL